MAHSALALFTWAQPRRFALCSLSSGPTPSASSPKQGLTRGSSITGTIRYRFALSATFLPCASSGQAVRTLGSSLGKRLLYLRAAQHSEGALSTTVNALRALCGSEWTPSELLLARTAPADLEPYRRFFRAPIRFDQETAALVLSAHWLKHRVSGADPAVRRRVEKRVLELEAASPSSLTDDLRRLLRVESMRARCTADEAAR